MHDKKVFLHLTSGTSPAEHVRLALGRLGRNERVLHTIDGLTAGPLADVDRGGASRLGFWAKVGGRKLSSADARQLDDSGVWRRIVESELPLVVWNSASPLDRLQTLRVCWYLRKEPRRLFEVKVPPHVGTSLPPWFGAVGIVGPAGLVKAWSTLKRIRNVEARAKRWVELRSHRGEWIRHLAGERIVELPISAYDPLLLRAASADWTSSDHVLGNVLAQVPTGTELVSWRIRELVRIGAMEARGRRTKLGAPAEIRAVIR